MQARFNSIYRTSEAITPDDVAEVYWTMVLPNTLV